MSPAVIKAVAKAKQALPGLASRNPDKADTKNSLIAPILRSLGWKVRDSKRVTEQFRMADYIKNKVDYALLDKSGTPRAFVKVKRLRGSLSDEAKLHRYVGSYLGSKGFQAAEELACIVFTNGREWRFYPINPRQVRQHYDGWYRAVDLEKEDTEQCAEGLSLLLSESSICNGSAKQLLTAEFRQQPAPVAIPPQPYRELPNPSSASEHTADAKDKKKRRKKKSRSRLQVTVGDKKFDSFASAGVAYMLPKVFQAVMDLKGVSGVQLVQICIGTHIIGRLSRTWVVSASMLAELRNSSDPGVRNSAMASQAIEGYEGYFVLTLGSTRKLARRLQQLGHVLGLGSALKVKFTKGS